MIWAALACVAIGGLSCIIFAFTCIRPALRVRTLVLRSQTHPTLRVASDARDSGESMAAAAALFESAGRRIGAAAASTTEAMVSVAGFASQVGATAAVVDSLLGLVVPRLRGMLAKQL